VGAVDQVVSMQAKGRAKPGRRALLMALTIIATAVVVTVALGMTERPSTDDATIDADIVHVAPAVGGRVIQLAVRENDLVRKGDLLFQLDPVPYQLAVNQAAANLDLARATLDTQSRFVSTQRSNAAIAAEQTRRARTNFALSARTEERLQPLTEKGYVPMQQLDQAQVATIDATTSVRQAQEQERAARRAVDTVAAAQAGVGAAQAALANAQRALDDTIVRAPHDGRIVGLTISTGEMAMPSQALFTLVNTEEWFAVANMRETDLHGVAAGDCATVYSMIDRAKAIKGVVSGVGWGVLDDDRINVPRNVPYVKPSVNWVRVAHRFPVRIRLEDPPQGLVRLGASVSVEVRHGAACR
jgi:membrane fusion protein, multidrug efflux system